MRISQMPFKPTPSGIESVPIFDPNEPIVGLRNKRVSLQSIMGQSGPAGKSAYQVWLDEGNTGTINDFFEYLKGPEGDSVYQTWLDAGNSGTIDDFLLSVKGDHGSTWYNGDGQPDFTIGIDGDYYIDNTTGIVYNRQNASWGTGTFSMMGVKGSLWFSDFGSPNTFVGGDQDYYLDQNNGDVYGPKLFGNWGSVILNLKGPAGSSWYAEPNAPGVSTGANGDYFIDISSGDVYGPKVIDDWGPIIGNLKGPSGVSGSSILIGIGAPDVGVGNNDDYYIDTTTGDFYGPKQPGDWGTPIFTLLQSLDSVLSIGATSEIPITIETSGGDSSVIHAGDNVEFNHYDGSGDSKTRLRSAAGLAGVVVTVTLPNHTGTIATMDDVDDAINALPDPITYVTVWDASTNTPTLADNDSIRNGSLYRVTVAGTQDFGSGNITFNVGDRVVKNEAGIWEKWDVNDEVTRVNGQVGEVELFTDDVQEEVGATNLYFTNKRAQTAVAAALTDSAYIQSVHDSVNDTITISLTQTSITIAGTSVDLGGSISRDTIIGVTDNGLIKRTGANTYGVAVAGEDFASPTNGTNGQALTSDGSGGFGTAVTLGSAATENTNAFDAAGSAATAQTNAENYANSLIVQTIEEDDTTHSPSSDAIFTALASKVNGSDIGVTVAPLVGGFVPSENIPANVSDIVLVDEYTDLPVTGVEDRLYVVRQGVYPIPDNSSYLWDGVASYGLIAANPGSVDNILGITSVGLIKRTGVDTYEPAVAGTDYAVATNGTVGQALVSDGLGGFGTAVTLGTAATQDAADFEPVGTAAALVVQTIDEDDVTHVPSGDAVYSALALKLDASEVGTTVAPLVAGLVPAVNLPSYVDDVIEVNEFTDLPDPGESGKIYVVLQGASPIPDNVQYRWTGSVYIELVASPGTTDNVAEGVGNLYFTDSRARTAVIAQTIDEDDVTHSPSSDVVFNALAGKADISSLAASATTDTTNATNITSGTLAKTRGGAGDISGLLKADGSGVVSAAVAGTDFAPITTGTDVLKGDGAGGTTTAIAGTDYVVPSQLLSALKIYDSVAAEIVTLGVIKSLRLPFDFTAIRFKASLETEQTSGNLVTIDIKQNGVSVFTTQLTFDNATTTTTAATIPAVLDVTDYQDDDVMTIEVTDVGDGTAEGLQVWLVGVAKP